jgi:hypothetical protein
MISASSVSSSVTIICSFAAVTPAIFSKSSREVAILTTVEGILTGSCACRVVEV